jgi:hypothetical protein
MTKKSDRLHQKVKFLQALKSVPSKNRNIIIHYLNDNGCQTIYETINNVLKSGSKSKSLKRKLNPFKKDLRFLADPKHKFLSKKKRLNKSGGLPILPILTTAIPILLEAFKALKK